MSKHDKHKWFNRSEKYIQSKILQYLKLNNVYVFKTMTSNKNGTLDIVGCYKGRFFAIEVKRGNVTPKDATTPLQNLTIKHIQLAGGLAIVTNKLEDVQILLRRILTLCEEVNYSDGGLDF